VRDNTYICAVVDRFEELAVFIGSSSGVVCFTSYRQCAQSEIFESRNIEFVNKVILFNWIINHR